MLRVIVDFDPPLNGADNRELAAEDLVYFLSWAFSARYGANHEMSAASLVLRGEFGVDLSPLLRFADREVEEAADEEELERAWQEAGPLAESCRQVLEAMSSDETRLRVLQDDYPGLSGGLEELSQLASRAAAAESRVRLTFEL